jgi:hypothetical protein
VRSILQTLQNVTDGWPNERSNGACARWRFDATWHGPSCLIKLGLRALNECIATLGEDIALSRGRAKICWQHDYAGAVKKMRYIADQIGLDNPIERAFLREKRRLARRAPMTGANTSRFRQRSDGVLCLAVASAASPKVRSEQGGGV